jgi:hypothetical protein
MGRADLIGNGKQHLVPTYQPIGTGHAHEGKRKSQPVHDAAPRAGKAKTTTPFRTQHTGLPHVPRRARPSKPR